VRSSSFWILLLSSLSLAGCPDEGARGQGDGSGTDGDDDDEGDGDSEPGDESGATSSDSDDPSVTSGTPQEDVPARGIAIADIDANPGVAIPIVVDGVWVDGPLRRAQIPRLRNTAFRIAVDVDETIWVPRPIEARFTVFQADGTSMEYRETADIAMDSSEASLQSNILVGVLAEDMQPGASFQVELYEAGGAYEGLPPVEVAPKALPEPGFIGIEGTYQNIRVMLVPVAYQSGGCNTMVDVSPESIAKYEDAMFQQNGVESIEIEVHEHITVTTDLTSSGGFFDFLNDIVQLRAQENPDPNVYYYGLFDNCGVCIGDGGGCLLGVAPGQPGSSIGEAGYRAAIGTQFLNSMEVGMETFVHEIGHTQGRAHVSCPGGDAAGPDPSYPHADGKIGVWGFGVRDFQIRSATSYSDYMSYCCPTWVSDWQWKATFERIRELSGWEMADMSELDEHHVLVGAHNTETGESEWWTDRGWIDGDRDAQYGVDFLRDGELVRSEGADVDAWSEGPWVTVRVPLEDGLADITAIDVHAPTGTSRVGVDRIRVYHGSAFATP
jgi:hypothetical protein